MTWLRWMLLISLFAAGCVVHEDASRPAAPPNCANVTDPQPTVVAVRCGTDASRDCTELNAASEVWVGACNVAGWASDCEASTRLAIHGHTLEELTPAMCVLNESSGWLRFDLDKIERGKDPGWVELVRGSKAQELDWVVQDAIVSVRRTGASLLLSSAPPVRFVVNGWLWFLLGVAADLIAVGLVWHYGRTTGMLREPAMPPPPPPASQPPAEDAEELKTTGPSTPVHDPTLRPYSLSRVQAAWWFCVVFVVWMTCTTLLWSPIAFSETALSLLGLSAITMAGKQVADSPPKPPTGSFWRDLLNDADGPALYRVQLVAWNLVFAFVFFNGAFETFVMPTLSSSYLALMGISGGTYVGFRSMAPTQ